MPIFHAVLPVHLLSKMLATTMPIEPRDGPSSRFKGALLNVTAGSAFMVSTDGCRLAHIETSHPIAGLQGNLRAVVPWETMAQIAGALSDAGPITPIELRKDRDVLDFKIAGHLLQSGRPDTWFADYRRVLKDDYSKIAILDRRSFEQAIERVAAFFDYGACVTRLNLHPGSLTVSAPGAEADDVAATVATNYQGEPLEASFNAQFLLEALRAMSDEQQVLFLIENPFMPAELRSLVNADGLRRRVLIMPLRV